MGACLVGVSHVTTQLFGVLIRKQIAIPASRAHVRRWRPTARAAGQKPLRGA